MDSYNFLVSQRLTVILAGNLLQARADQTIVTDLIITMPLVTKMNVKVRKRTGRTAANRRTNAPVDDINLRCNHSTNHIA